MFNRYWRDYPWMFQLIQFVILLFITASFFIWGVIPLVAKLTGVPASDVTTLNSSSGMRQVRAAMLYQFIGGIGIFLIPALMFGYFTHPKPIQYLGLKRPGKPVQWFWVVAVILSAIPVLLGIQSLISTIEVSEAIRKMQEERQRGISNLLTMPSAAEFAMAFITLAILPAVSEELFFRGVMFKMAAKGTRKIIFSIVLTAIVFALFHADFYGFISIFMAGILLGFIYYLTGSLWLSMLAHAIHNGLQIILVYFFKGNETIQKMIENDTLPWYIPVMGFVFFMASFYMLWKNRTPLPADWIEDFTEEEKKAFLSQDTEDDSEQTNY